VAQTTMVQTPLGDSLRDLAAVVDAAPSIDAGREHPHVPASAVMIMRSALAVEALAADLGTPVGVWTSEETGSVHTSTEVVCGTVGMRFAHIGTPARVLHRNPAATDELAERDA
jgi:hypothetical protein